MCPLRQNQDPAPRLLCRFLAAPPLSLCPLPSLFSNCLNLPCGSQGRSWRLPMPRSPTRSCLVLLPLKYKSDHVIPLVKNFHWFFHNPQTNTQIPNRGFWAPVKSNPVFPLWLHCILPCPSLTLLQPLWFPSTSEPFNFALSVPSLRILFPQVPSWLAPMLHSGIYPNIK